jgi:hypothetical protein
MVELCFHRSLSNTQEAVAIAVEELKQAKVDETITELVFEDYDFDEDTTVHAVIDLLHRAFQKGRQLGCLRITDCTGRVDEILHVASSLNMFGEISLYGNSDDLSRRPLSHRGFWSISAAMKFHKRLTKLHLSEMEMTRQQSAALGAGLITSNSQNHFKELYMNCVKFADGAITELASGLKQNSSLGILNVTECNLGDTELAELAGAVESHPSLKVLSLWNNAGQEHALVALGKVLASRSCRLEKLDFSSQGMDDDDHDGLSGHLGILAQGLRWNESPLTRLDLSDCRLRDDDIDDLGQILASCKLETLNLSGNRITHSGFVSLTQNIPKSLKSFNLCVNEFNADEVACHALTLFEEHPQLWEDGFDWLRYSKSPIHQKIQHFKDLNRCGRILLVAGDGGAIPLSVWPLVLARANTLLSGDYKEERTHTAIFHLLQGPALMQRRLDRDFSQATSIEPGASEQLPTSSKRGPDETITQASAKKGRSE